MRIASDGSGMRRVIVVGAGGSHCCDFPLGHELLPRMARPLKEMCPSLDHPAEELEEIERERRQFVQACMNTSISTVDEFLRRRSAFRQVGGLALAAALVDAQLKVVRNRRTNSTWHTAMYRELFMESRRWLDESDLSPVSVVTFNYDLNLEITIARRYLGDNECHAFDAWSKATSRPVFHVHGDLDLDEQVIAMLEDDEYHPSISLGLLQDMSRSLRLSTDTSGIDADAVARIRSLIWAADQIVFIGFGFDPSNLERIGIGSQFAEWAGKRREIISTSVGLDDNFMTAIRERCGPIQFMRAGLDLSTLATEALRPSGKLAQWIVNAPSVYETRGLLRL